MGRELLRMGSDRLWSDFDCGRSSRWTVSDGTGMLPGGMTTVAGLTFSSYMGHADTLGTFLQGAAGGGWDNFHQAMTSETISFAGTAFGTTPIGALLFSGVVNSAGMIGGPPQDVHCL